MTTLRKALPLLLLCAALFAGLPLAAQDCSFTFTFTDTSNPTQPGFQNLSNGTPCVNWRITFSTTGTLQAHISFETSVDNSTWPGVSPTVLCSNAVQPPCIWQGTNPLTGTQSGMSYFAVYDNYIRVEGSNRSGTGTATVRGYGAKGSSAAAMFAPAVGAGSGTVTNTGSLTAGAFVTGNGGVDVKTPSATSTLDASGNASFAGILTGAATLQIGNPDSAFVPGLQGWTFAANNINRINPGIVSTAGFQSTVQSTSGAEGIWGVSYILGSGQEADGVTADSSTSGSNSTSIGLQARGSTNAGTGQTVYGADGYAEATQTSQANLVAAMHARSVVASQSAAITNGYGLLVENQTAATNNWAIKTGSGKVEFDDSLIVPDLKPTANLTITQNAVIPVTFIGAAALADTLYVKAGNVGINTNNPLGKLHILLATSQTLRTLQSGNMWGFALRGAGDSQVATFTADGGTGEIRIGSAFSTYFPTFFSGAAERARIETAGCFDVGITGCAYSLDVSKGVGLTGTARFFDQTATTGATLVNVTPGASQTTASTTFANGGSSTVAGIMQVASTGVLQQLPRTTDPGCTTVADIGKFWFDNTTTTTARKACNNVAGTLTWVAF